MRLIPLSLRWALGVSLLVLAGTAQAAPLKLPDALAGWAEWVLHDQKERDCPFLYRQQDRRFCAWPGELQLEVNRGKATFAQPWDLFAESEIQLPGDALAWPQAVQVNGKPGLVTERQGHPVLVLPAGRHQVSGEMTWKKRPEFLQLPPQTAKLRARIDGALLQHAEIDAQGRLWLGRKPAGKPVRANRDSHTLRVFRRLEDSIPRVLETQIVVQVSGSERELQVGRALLEGFVPLRLDSQLPARIEPDGSLRMQVRPGQWQLTLLARQISGEEAVGPGAAAGGWPTQEVWSFAAQRHLRSVEVSGVPGIDPQQTAMPEPWKNLPAYLLEPGARLQLTEQQRGDSDPAPDELNLKRRLILDFDGGAYTVEDRVRGQLHRDRRLSMQQPFQLGRAEVSGQPQLITRMGKDEPAGLELRQGTLDLLAVSRAERGDTLAAAGWTTAFKAAQTSLQLPPGWDVFGVRGADRAHPTWISRWSLWDIFLVLIIGASFARLYNLRIGALALLAVVLAYHHANAPLFSWLNLAAVLALLRLVPESRVRKLFVFYRNVSMLVLLIIGLPWAVDQVRLGLYPQLERPWQVVQAGGAPDSPVEADLQANEEMAARMANESEHRKLSRMKQSMPRMPGGAGAVYALEDKVRESDPSRGYDAGALIQTGPGLPAWEWRRVQIAWNGPLASDEELSIYYMPPWLNRGLRFLAVALYAALALILVLHEFRRQGRWAFRDPELGAGNKGAGAALIVLLTAGGLLLQPSGSAQAADFPPPEYLEELRKRLLEPPQCLPACADLPALRVRVEEDALLLELDIIARENVSIPLPHGRQGWRPETWELFTDGRSQEARIQRDAQQVPHVQVGSGRHVVRLRGALRGMDEVALEFPLKPRSAEASATGWQVSGIADGRLQSNSLSLQRLQPSRVEPDTVSELFPDPAPVFLRVDRTLTLADEWRLHSRVVRVAPVQGPIHATLPLWPGERVTTAGLTIQDGNVRVVLGARQHSFAWTSVLDPVEALELQAGKEAHWVERWRVQADQRWHIEHSGLAPVLEDGARRPGVSAWQPWPGETLQLRISKPVAIAGPTLTLESAQLVHTPGKRNSETRLRLSLRSSQGGDYEFPLPAGAQLHALVVDGAPQILPQRRDRVRIPLHPGTLQAEVTWRQTQAVGWLTRTPAPDLGHPAANINMELHMPADRWLLLTGGPQIGPAVLFWGVLVVVVLVSVALGRSGTTPLRSWQWMLLGAAMLATETIAAAIFVVGWFFLLARRGKMDTGIRRDYFNLMQIGLALLSALAIGSLLGSIPAGLLSQPDMQIVGNGSGGRLLRWYQDFSAAQLPHGWVVSAPMWLYRVTMLAWSLWLAVSLLGWLRWGWAQYSANGLWRRKLVTASVSGEQDVAVAAVRSGESDQTPGKSGD